MTTHNVEYCLNCGSVFTYPICAHCGHTYSTKDEDLMKKTIPMGVVWVIIILLLAGIFGFVYVDILSDDHSFILSYFS